MSLKLKVPTKEELEKLYNGGVCPSISSLARHYKTSNPTVRKWLIGYGIERKTNQKVQLELGTKRKNPRPSKEELEEYYKNHSIAEVVKKYRVSQIRLNKWMNEYNIPYRGLSEGCKLGKQKQFAHMDYDKDVVEEAYYNSSNIEEAANFLSVSYSKMKSLLRKYDIETKKPWRSKAEMELYDFCCSLDSSFMSCDRSIINPYELDIVSHKHKIAIEYCGLYWHSTLFKTNTYHRDKMRMCNDKGYELITVFEGDDINKVKSLIRSKLGLQKRIFARKCDVREITSKEAGEFNDLHHLSGRCGAKHHIGLFHNDTLIMVNSIGKNRYSKESEYECIRMTSHSDYSVVGGASKTFKYFVRNYSPNSITTFSDLRFGRGEVYTKCGFVHVDTTYPNYWYFKNYSTQLESRVKYQKHKLHKLLDNFDLSLTESSNMENNGYLRIFDCGNNKYVWTK